MLGHASPLTAPTSRLLCTVASVRTQLGVDASQDATIQAWIEIVADAFADDPEALARPPYRQRWSERRPGDGGHRLLLSRWPVEQVHSVTYGLSSPETVAATAYSIASQSHCGGLLGSRDHLYATDGWAYSSERSARGGLDPAQAGTRPLDYAVDYTAGWLMTDQVTTWAATTASAVAAFVRPTTAGALLRYECTTAGTSGGSEPTWPTTEGETVTDGTAVWTARGASEVPLPVQQAATLQAAEWFAGGLELPVGLQAEEHEDHKVQYDFVAMRGGLALMPAVRALLRPYR